MRPRTTILPDRRSARTALARLLALGLAAAAGPAYAQDRAAGAAAAAAPSWLLSDLAAAARSEGSLTVYSSMNEQEGLPLWKMFEDATGVKVNYVRSSDSIILARIAIENRARQRSWDLAVTTTVNRLPNDALLPFDPPEARSLIPQARDPDRRWYGVYANYNTPAYNTNLVKRSDLPNSYEDFLGHKEWAGKIALDDTDDEWLSAMIVHYGEERGKKLLKDIVAALKPVMVDGHLALARSVGVGRILARPQQLCVAYPQCAVVRRRDRLLGARSGRPVLRFCRRQLAGAACQGRAAGRKLRAEPGGRAVPDQARPHADPAGCAGQPRSCERRVEGKENHCHYLRRGRAEEVAGDVQGNLQTEISPSAPDHCPDRRLSRTVSRRNDWAQQPSHGRMP